MYKIFYITAVEKDIKFISKSVNDLITHNYFPVLSKNPFSGKFLLGEFKGYLSYSFSHQGTEYRIIYQILKESAILVIMIGSRENIYKRLKRRI